MKSATDERRTQNRRFRTVPDAANWIARHHPEINLDKPYHKHSSAK